MPKTSENILLTMRTGRSSNEGLPLATGKSQWSRERYGREYNLEPRITFTPRPHIQVKIQGREYNALLDGGSEISLINYHTANILASQGFETRKEKGEIYLANESTSETRGSMRIPLQVGSRRVKHNVIILPDMEKEMIIGIDLQYRLQLGIPSPPRSIKKWLPKCNAAVQTPDEKEQLQQFLEEELKKFEKIHEPTSKIEHHIRLKDKTPIKQRYRPRNLAMQTIINEEVNEMLKQRVIESSHSSWSSPIVIVKKKDGKHRFCIDFRRVTT